MDEYKKEKWKDVLKEAASRNSTIGGAVGATIHAVNKQADLEKVRDLKRAYKNDVSLWNRCVNKITGKAPKWRRVAKYNSKELNGLLSTYKKTGSWDGIKDKINNKIVIREMAKEQVGRSI